MSQQPLYYDRMELSDQPPPLEEPKGIQPDIAPAFEAENAVEPGVYFNMPNDQYQKLPALSSTGLKLLRVSGMDFWARSWMNQWRAEDKKEDESEAKEIGSAYHTRLLEGREKFLENYAPTFVCDNPDALKGNKALTDRLKELEVKGLSGKTQAELCELLRNADPSAVIWHDLEAAYLKEHEGQTLIDWSAVRRIELAASMIDNHPQLKYFFKGGFPEVTCVWDDEEYGVRCKARFDYLKTRATNDLKSFQNKSEKPLEKAIYAAMASYKYFVSGAWYLRGNDEAKKHVAAGRVFGADGVSDNWLKAFQESPPHDMNFVFQQKGVAPVTRNALFSRQDQMFGIGTDVCREACETFKQYYRHYGAEPWVDLSDEIVLVSGSYPLYAYEI